jgi:hypothetical protein
MVRLLSQSAFRNSTAFGISLKNAKSPSRYRLFSGDELHAVRIAGKVVAVYHRV